METIQNVQETPAVEAPKPQQNYTVRKNDDGSETFVVEANTRLLTTAEQEELDDLSKTVFGASSRWATLLKKGLMEAVTEEVEEYVPAEGDKPEETRKVVVPVMYRSPKRGLTTIPLLRKVTFTVESVKAYMLDLKAKQDAIRTMLEKMADDRAAEKKQKELEQQVAAAAAGSVV